MPPGSRGRDRSRFGCRASFERFNNHWFRITWLNILPLENISKNYRNFKNNKRNYFKVVQSLVILVVHPLYPGKHSSSPQGLYIPVVCVMVAAGVCSRDKPQQKLYSVLTTNHVSLCLAADILQMIFLGGTSLGKLLILAWKSQIDRSQRPTLLELWRILPTLTNATCCWLNGVAP